MKIVLGFVAVLLIVSGAVLWRRWSGSPAAAPGPDVGPIMEAFAAEAVTYARDRFGVALDYSPESIERAEEVLGRLHEEFKSGGLAKQTNTLAMMFGAYVGECIRRTSPGASWARDHAVVGDNTFPLQWEGGESFPCGWCLKRLEDGEADNVWHKYQMLLAMRRGEEGGIEVTPK